MNQNPPYLPILFAGQSVSARMVDGVSGQTVFVRSLPQRYLARVLECFESAPRFVELCCYLPAADAAGLPPGSDIPAPAGLVAVPTGWADNLSDESLAALCETASALNFSRAAKWAEGQIAAKKRVAPLHEAALTQVLPLVEKLLQPLVARLAPSSTSTPSAPSSPAAAASSS